MFDPRTISKLSAGFTSFVFAATQISLVALFPTLSERTGLDLVALIALFSLGSFCFVVGSPYWAAKSESSGRARVLAIGSTALLLSFALLFVAASTSLQSHLSKEVVLTLILASRLIYGLFASALPPVAQLIWRDTAQPNQVVRAMANHSASLNFGRVAGLSVFLIPGVQASQVLGLLFVIIAFSLLLNLVIALKSKRERTLQTGVSLNTSFKKIRWALAMALVFTVFIEALSASMGGTIQHVFDTGTETASKLTAQILLFASVGVLATQIALRSMKLSWKLILPVGIFALLLGSILFSQMQSIDGLRLAVLALVAGIALVPPAYLAMLYEDGSTAKGAGILTSTHTVGYALGGAIAAVAFEFSHRSIAYVLGALAVIMILIFTLQIQGLRSRGLA